MLLERDGHEVTTAHDGPSALELLVTEAFDVVLLDIGLPGISGYEVARRARAEQRAQQPMFIALTGYGRPDDRQAAELAGFDLHLVKPVEPKSLAQVVAQAPSTR